ncbi:MAG: class I SAM-dependent methyltransferase [Lewinellaceae bacterium]|nr:class I SAM-dependent methyltransferase [Lewinellaceae bacterium]
MQHSPFKAIAIWVSIQVLVLGWVPSLPAQEVYRMAFPPTLSSVPAYQEALQQEETLRHFLLHQVDSCRQASSSQNLTFYLDALRQSLEAKRPVADQIQLTLPIDRTPDHFRQVLVTKSGQWEAALADIQRFEDSYHLIDPTVTSFPAIPPTDLQAELIFYDLREGMVIAEIGAGNAQFAAQAGNQLKSLRYFINDIDPQLVSDIALQIQRHPFFTERQDQFIPVLGTIESPRLHPSRVDVILMRNALHHFSAPEAMLQAIREALVPGGTLYLRERFADSCAVDCCPDLWSRSKLIDVMAQAGFRLLRQQTLRDAGAPDSWVLAFSVDQP